MGYLIYPQEWEAEIGVRVTGGGERVNQKDCSEYFGRFFQLIIILKVSGNV